jgi:pimeloyl-ACP methyl ester carboxylesterase
MPTPLLVLHGALGAADQFNDLRGELAKSREVFAIDLPGHGAHAHSDTEYAIDVFSQGVIDWLDASGLESVDIFGYSMGGYVACRALAMGEKRIRKVATLGTKFFWDPESTAKEVSFVDAEVMQAKVPAYATALAERHGVDHWKSVVARTARMMTALGASGGFPEPQLAEIAVPVLVGVGDRDTTAGVEPSVRAWRCIPKSSLAVLPSTPHPWEKVSLPTFLSVVGEWLSV